MTYPRPTSNWVSNWLIAGFAIATMILTVAGAWVVTIPRSAAGVQQASR